MASPLYHLTLARVREAVREPGVLFWVFGFPILLAVGLGLAFRGRGPEPVVVYGDLPKSVGARPGLRGRFVVFADSTVQLDLLALVPLSNELSPPPPKPWQALDGHPNPAGE